MQAKFAIIGCGRIAPNHLDAIAEAPSATLVAACDIIEEKAKAVADEWGCNYYTDIETMLESEEIDVCCILTPSGMHAEHACIVAKHKVNVLCEKPLDVTEENMQKMINCCKENGVKLGAIFQRRFFDAAIETKKAIEKGYLGKIALATASLKYFRDQEYYDSGEWRATWELDGGGALMNQGIHGVDLISWMMGGIESVDALCKTQVWDIVVEDTAVVRVKYKNGAIGVIEGTTCAYPGLDNIFSIHGSEGSISFGNDGFLIWDLKDKNLKKPETNGSMGGLNCKYNVEVNTGHDYQIEDMARAVLENRDPEISGEEAMESVKIILKIYESSRKGVEVKL